MDKLYSLDHQVTKALQLSTDKVNDDELFSALEDDASVSFEIY